MNIFGVTTSRADYGILKPFYKKIDKSNKYNLSILVTGSHHNTKYGNTFNEIKKDKYSNIINLKTNFSDNNITSLSQSIASIYKDFSKYYNKYKPNLIILLGDRFELLPYAHLSVIHNIKILHIHGGEITDGSMDNKFRNAISALSDYHYVSNIESFKLLKKTYYIHNVFNIGSMAINSICKTKFLSKKKLSEKINFNFQKKFFLIIIHPNTFTFDTELEMKKLLDALTNFTDASIIFISPNADQGSEIIRENYSKFIKNNKNTVLLKSLDSLTYYSLVNNANVVIGNSSSGIIEVPSIGTPSINLGQRQKGRLNSNSVISTDFNKNEILKSIKIALSRKFLNKINKSNLNPYYKKNSIQLAMKYLKDIKDQL